jgi:hypothetical protein
MKASGVLALVGDVAQALGVWYNITGKLHCFDPANLHQQEQQEQQQQPGHDRRYENGQEQHGKGGQHHAHTGKGAANARKDTIAAADSGGSDGLSRPKPPPPPAGVCTGSTKGWSNAEGWGTVLYKN